MALKERDYSWIVALFRLNAHARRARGAFSLKILEKIGKFFFQLGMDMENFN